MKLRKLPLLAALCAPLASHAVVLGYWDMDSSTIIGKLPANGGSQAGSLGAAFEEISAGFYGEIDPSISGTTVNLIPPASATNRSVGFSRAGSIYYDGAFVMNDFDFSGMTEATISFAYRAENFFTWDTNLEVDYRINDGAWVDIDENQVYSTDWTLASIALGAATDGQSNVDIRIRTQSWASVSGYLDLDNVKVEAVPEPQTYALLAGAAMLGLAIYRRRRG